ncbi:MAG: DUF3857 domain-containing protein, partial [Verrucomicrobiota bacterium]|nr:DUF3857 domain-containing protein [Verrucomicrobiota bacterium]
YSAIIHCKNKTIPFKIKSFQNDILNSENGEKIPLENIVEINFQSLEKKKKRKNSKISSKIKTELRNQKEKALKCLKKYSDYDQIQIIDDGIDIKTIDKKNKYIYRYSFFIAKKSALQQRKISLHYQKGTSSTHLDFAYVLDSKGSFHTLKHSELKESVPTGKGGRFFDTRTIRLSGELPGVDVGSLIYVQYTYDDYNPEDPRMFFPAFYFRGTKPVLQSTFRIKIPSEMTLQFLALDFPKNTKNEPDISRTKEYTTYKWELSDMEPIKNEPRMPPLGDFVPRVLATTLKSWKPIFELNSKYELKNIKVTPEIKKLTKKIIGKRQTKSEKLQKIYHWVQQNITYVSVKSSLSSGLGGHPAAETIKNAFGDCIDKSIVLATLGKTVDIEIYPVGLMTNDRVRMVKEIPYLRLNHAISEVHLDNKIFYLDPTGTSSRYPSFSGGDTDVNAINFIKGTIRKIPLPSPEKHGKKVELNIELTNNGNLKIISHAKYVGDYESGVRGFWKNQPENQWNEKMLAYLTTQSPQVKLNNFKLSDLTNLDSQLTIDIDYSRNECATIAGELMILNIPEIKLNFPEVSLKKRSYPLRYRTSSSRIIKMTIKLPENYNALELPKPMIIKNISGITYSAQWKISENKNIIFTQKFLRNSREIQTEKYPKYRKDLQKIEKYTNTPLYLNKKK